LLDFPERSAIMSKPTPRAPEPKPANAADDRLDEALEETFPASDPIAVHPEEDKVRIPKGVGRTLH
jgi:hypothetical protein